MKRVLPVIIMAMAVSFSVTGCLKTGQTQMEITPDMSVPDEMKFNFVQLHNDTMDMFLESEVNPYVYVEDVDVNGSDERDVIILKAVLSPEADEEDARHFASALVAHAGDAAANQYPNLEGCRPDDFGDIYKKYGLELEFTDAAGSLKFSLNVPAGGKIELDPDYEKFEEQWASDNEHMMSNITYDAAGNIVSYGDEETDKELLGK